MRCGFREYVRAIQDERSCHGLEAFCHAHNGSVPHKRTIYRWHRRLGSSLVVSPLFAVEALGLSHVHAFLTKPSSTWEGFPYALDYAWVTPDCKSRVLYLHCVVPTAHESVVVGQLRSMASSCDLLTTSTGWERLLPTDDESFPPLQMGRAGSTSVLRDMPLVVPAVFESYGRTQSLDRTWTLIRERLGSSVRAYLPRQRYYPTNGKRHVRNAFSVLSEEGLFVQYVVQYQPSVESGVDAFVLDEHRRATEFLKSARADCTMVKAHPGKDECLLRVAGTHGLFDRLVDAGTRRVYWLNRQATTSCGARVRFAYEQLFDPTTGEWCLPGGGD